MIQSEKTLTALHHIPGEVLCARDYEALATNFITKERYAYIAGGSGHDVTLRNNSEAFSDYSITPRTLRDVSKGSTKTNLIGSFIRHPILLAPVAYQSLVHPHAELATAFAAESTDTCMVASTLSTVTLEEIAENTGPDRWFQLYFQPSDADTASLVHRAVKAGYNAIVVTVDAAVQVPSIRAMRAGFQLPDDIVPANTLRHKTSVMPAGERGQSHIFQSYVQNAPTIQKLRALIKASPIPVLVKGVLHPEDAKEIKEMGAAGIIVSNHGGRTLDGAPASLSVISSIRMALGKDFPLLLDSGIRSGSDIFKAIALGADAVLIGRLQVYALSVAGALGVAHMIKLLREELELTMAMAGCSGIEEIKATELHRNWER